MTIGTDIHVYVEKWDGERWQLASPMATNRDQYSHLSDDNPWGDKPCIIQLYNARNYDLFAILADVRNGRGFAGIKTGDGFNTISTPRGLPNDLSEGLMMACGITKIEPKATDGRNITYAKFEDDSMAYLGEHSFTWLTLDEILKFDWTQRTINRGMVTLAEFCRLREFHLSQPEEWCGAISGPKIEIISQFEADKRLAFARQYTRLSGWKLVNWIKETIGGFEVDVESSDLDGDVKTKTIIDVNVEKVHVEYEWASAYYECCRHFWSSTVPRLLRLANSVGSHKRVRLVMGFDS